MVAYENRTPDVTLEKLKHRERQMYPNHEDKCSRTLMNLQYAVEPVLTITSIERPNISNSKVIIIHLSTLLYPLEQSLHHDRLEQSIASKVAAHLLLVQDEQHLFTIHCVKKPLCIS